MISNNWTPLSITVNCGGGTDTTALVEELKDNEANDVLMAGRITSLETGLISTNLQVNDVKNATTTIAGMLSNETTNRTNIDIIHSNQISTLQDRIEQEIINRSNAIDEVRLTPQTLTAHVMTLTAVPTSVPLSVNITFNFSSFNGMVFGYWSQSVHFEVPNDVELLSISGNLIPPQFGNKCLTLIPITIILPNSGGVYQFLPAMVVLENNSVGAGYSLSIRLATGSNKILAGSMVVIYPFSISYPQAVTVT